MRVTLLTALVFLTAGSQAAVVNVPLKPGVVLNPGQAYTLTIDASSPTEIGWRAVQARRCTTNCIQMTLLTTPSLPPFSAALGAQGNYTPVGGKISVEYKNVSTQPVTIDIFRITRTCGAEACRFIDPAVKGRWLVYKIAAFKSIVTSQDGSYSTISGTTLGGRPFTVRAVWWTDDKTAMRHCATFIQRDLDTHVPAEKYRPYILSGQATGEGNSIVLKSIDDCVPNAPNFGVPDANVFKCVARLRPFHAGSRKGRLAATEPSRVV